MTQSAIRLDPSRIRDIGPEVLESDGTPRVLPAAAWRGFSVEERALLCMRHALYGLPTVELIAWLQAFIDGREALEIGSGCGVLARASGIRATDNWMQAAPEIQAIYAAQGQPTIRYGAHVERIDAVQAVREHRPEVVVACWVTHAWREDRAAAGGNMFGVDE